MTNLPYDPKDLKRELKKFYLSADNSQIQQMLSELNLKTLDDLFSHIDSAVKFNGPIGIGAHFDYHDLIKHMQSIAAKNNLKTNFISGGLPSYKIPDIVGDVCRIRGLTTAYTPYQPERSQGTLLALWIYSSALSILSGFEAVNASMYERSTCLFEALNTATRIKRKNSVLVFDSIYPKDKEVLETLSAQTKLKIIYVPFDLKAGTTHLDNLEQLIHTHQDDLAAVAFPQVNAQGNLEDFHSITDLIKKYKLLSIGIIDPMLLSSNGLSQPSKWGSSHEGIDIFVAEGQHLCLAPNFGGPGLGILGIRYNEKNKTNIRSTPGRYVGEAKDIDGKICKAMVLSTREQHIRREKATSNICSNQSFLAVIAGASLLSRGDEGLSKTFEYANTNAKKLACELLTFSQVELTYPNATFVNEFAITTPLSAKELVSKACEADLHLYANPLNDKSLLISVTDLTTKEDMHKLTNFFSSLFTKDTKKVQVNSLSANSLRQEKCQLPKYSKDELITYYHKLGKLNVSPDENLYPLGSCTMKYNPYINDYAASLKGFTDSHPLAPEADVQGCLEILYEIQELFKKITGLAAVTTQPVAGAQGELVGLKMFQKFHLDNGEGEQRNIVLIPRSAHGTNPASATMAGYLTSKDMGIVLIEADTNGEMNFNQLKEAVEKYNSRIAAIMITNPNTSGVFEKKFKEIAQLIHSVGGLVYMDGANMNAIAGKVDLGKLGVDAVHNNLHKTWTIPHGGGGPGDAIVAVSDKLIDYLPGAQIKLDKGVYSTYTCSNTIGSCHRHFGNFAHKVRCYTYIKALGDEGVRKMSEVAVLSARYLFHKICDLFPTIPAQDKTNPIMHEFIITLSEEIFESIASNGIAKANIIGRIGKLFLDFGIHAPTVSFPETYGLMIEPTESFSKDELDRFVEILVTIKNILENHPKVLETVPHFTAIKRVDEVWANKNLKFYDDLKTLPQIYDDLITPKDLQNLPLNQINEKIVGAHSEVYN